VAAARAVAHFVGDGCSLLWAVDRGSSGGSGQGVVDVAGDDDLDLGKPGVQPGQVDAGDLRKSSAAAR